MGAQDEPRRGAVFVMPRASTEWADAAAMWITAAGWADAARRRLGAGWVVTPDAVAGPAAARAYTRPRPPEPGGAPRRRYAAVPIVVRTGLKDALRARAARRWRDPGERPEWAGTELAFVWQHHDLFHRAGEPLARRHRCPLVSYVHAPQVWEAARWGVRRPGWGRLLERTGERPQLLASDVVACVSDEVGTEVVRLGVDPARVLVSPMAVDAEQFSPTVSGAGVRARLGLDGTFVVGWTGSFRRFHGLELAVEALAGLAPRVPEARLLLVGEGFERARIEQLVHARALDGAVVFAGAAGHDEVPAYVAAMDVALVTARAGEEFHYSPLKLREYLAAGIAVAAPRLGEVPRTVTDGDSALLYDAGDAPGLAARLVRLHDDPALRAQLGAAGRALMVATGTWDVQLERLLASEPFARATARLAAGSAA